MTLTEATDPTSLDRPLLHCRQLSKRFANGTLALKEVDLQIGEQQFVSLLGPSGCGKSTLLKLIAGLGTPSSGAIVWPGRAVGAAPEVARTDAHHRVTKAEPGREPTRSDLSFVFQEPTLLPWADAASNVALPLKLVGVAKADRLARAREALASVGLAGFERVYPRQLSGGMKMRVSIARALVTRPRLLLMDEPFAALDEITRARLNTDLLALWQRERFTVVFVTHSVYESVFLSQRIVVMAARPGRIGAELTVDEPYPRPPAYRRSIGYAGHCERASAALEHAMAAQQAVA